MRRLPHTKHYWSRYWDVEFSDGGILLVTTAKREKRGMDAINTPYLLLRRTNI